MGKPRKIAGVAAATVATGAAALFAAPATAQASPAPCGGETAACIDLSANQAWIMDKNGHVTYGAVPITSGRPGYETPAGSFRVIWEDVDHWSQAYNGPMPYSVFFTDSGIAFHEGSLSVPSHGCVHLSPAAARKFFHTLEPGNVVTVVP
jgi:hypothetical protein